MKISTLCLSSCTGCHVALLHLGDKFLDILAAAELVYSPLLMDGKRPAKCDVAFVEGALRNDEDVERVKALRDAAKTLVALGTCANYGGIAGLGNAASRGDTMTHVYPATPRGHMPGLLPRVAPVDSIVDVDYYVPGCPPPPEVVANFLGSLLKGEKPEGTDLPVCAECPRKVKGDFSPDIKRSYETRPDPDECLLQQGFVCLGSVTRAGCGAPCTAAGAPCMGCRGPTNRLMLDPTHGVYEDWLRHRCHYLEIPESEAAAHLHNIRHTLYAFTLSSPMMRRKKSEHVANETYRVNWDREADQAEGGK